MPRHKDKRITSLLLCRMHLMILNNAIVFFRIFFFKVTFSWDYYQLGLKQMVILLSVDYF